MDSEGNGSVDRYEFLKYMLVHMGKVQQGDIDKVRLTLTLNHSFS